MHRKGLHPFFPSPKEFMCIFSGFNSLLYPYYFNTCLTVVLGWLLYKNILILHVIGFKINENKPRYQYTVLLKYSNRVFVTLTPLTTAQVKLRMLSLPVKVAQPFSCAAYMQSNLKDLYGWIYMQILHNQVMERY